MVATAADLGPRRHVDPAASASRDATAASDGNTRASPTFTRCAFAGCLSRLATGGPRICTPCDLWANPSKRPDGWYDRCTGGDCEAAIEQDGNRSCDACYARARTSSARKEVRSCPSAVEAHGSSELSLESVPQALEKCAVTAERPEAAQEEALRAAANVERLAEVRRARERMAAVQKAADDAAAKCAAITTSDATMPVQCLEPDCIWPALPASESNGSSSSSTCVQESHGYCRVHAPRACNADACQMPPVSNGLCQVHALARLTRGFGCAVVLAAEAESEPVQFMRVVLGLVRDEHVALCNVMSRAPAEQRLGAEARERLLAESFTVKVSFAEEQWALVQRRTKTVAQDDGLPQDFLQLDMSSRKQQPLSAKRRRHSDESSAARKKHAQAPAVADDATSPTAQWTASAAEQQDVDRPTSPGAQQDVMRVETGASLIARLLARARMEPTTCLQRLQAAVRWTAQAVSATHGKLDAAALYRQLTSRQQFREVLRDAAEEEDARLMLFPKVDAAQEHVTQDASDSALLPAQEPVALERLAQGAREPGPLQDDMALGADESEAEGKGVDHLELARASACGPSACGPSELLLQQQGLLGRREVTLAEMHHFRQAQLAKFAAVTAARTTAAKAARADEGRRRVRPGLAQSNEQPALAAEERGWASVPAQASSALATSAVVPAHVLRAAAAEAMHAQHRAPPLSVAALPHVVREMLVEEVRSFSALSRLLSLDGRQRARRLVSQSALKAARKGARGESCASEDGVSVELVESVARRLTAADASFQPRLAAAVLGKLRLENDAMALVLQEAIATPARQLHAREQQEVRARMVFEQQKMQQQQQKRAKRKAAYQERKQKRLPDRRGGAQAAAPRPIEVIELE